jgi:UDP-N-acetyl-2-amino-2-deoxyglucuronate dehydrogenase
MTKYKPKFAIIGAAGYVAPRHMQAIKDIGGEIIAALDPCDSVGILDRFAPDCAFFTEPERFMRWLSKERHCGGSAPDWVSVCSPNWLHDAHVRIALQNDCKVILEKPAVLSARNIDALVAEFGDKVDDVFVMHQLRWHEDAEKFKKWVEMVREYESGRYLFGDIEYHTPRGPWYKYSWKGDEDRSGGPIANLGIHFLDILCWLLGPAEKVYLNRKTEARVQGAIYFDGAKVNFDLSTSFSISDNGKPIRRFTLNNEAEWKFDSGFEGLHSKAYDHAVHHGIGIRLSGVRNAVALAEKIRLTPIKEYGMLEE